jgi:hypothetical protein
MAERISVQKLMLDRLNNIETKLDQLMPEIAALKVKAAIAGGMAGLVGTGLLSFITTLWK